MVKQSTRKARRAARQPIHRWDQVPQFTSEQEEQTFWDTHTLGKNLLDQMQRGGPDDLQALPTRESAREPTHSRTIAVRFEDDVLKRVRAVAIKKHIGYQTLLKAFVLERLYEEEKREGLIA